MAKTGYLCYAVFNTEPGWVAVLASDKGIKRLAVPQRTAERALELLGPTIRDVKPHPNFLRDIIKLLRHYFQGREITFPEICDLGEATSFQRRVWEATRLIPYGETQSYRWVADQVGHKGAARAVGQALSQNPVPIIIPCHRVLGYNGSLCGFSCGLGWKRFLLELEAESAPVILDSNTPTL